MDISRAAECVRFVVTGEGGIDLRGEDLTWGQACDRIARTQPAAVLVTRAQVCDWAMKLKVPTLDYLVGAPLILRES